MKSKYATKITYSCDIRHRFIQKKKTLHTRVPRQCFIEVIYCHCNHIHIVLIRKLNVREWRSKAISICVCTYTFYVDWLSVWDTQNNDNSRLYYSHIWRIKRHKFSEPVHVCKTSERKYHTLQVPGQMNSGHKLPPCHAYDWYDDTQIFISRNCVMKSCFINIFYEWNGKKPSHTTRM